MPPKPSTPLEFDVVVCCRAPGGVELAREVVADLLGRGFRVFFEPLDDEAALGGALRAVEDTPDLVVVVTPGTFDAAAREPGDRLGRLLAHALATGRNIVPLLAAPEGELSTSNVPPGLEALARVRAVWYYEGTGYKAAMSTLAHRLSSETGLEDRRVERRFKRFFVVALAVLVAGFALQAVPLLVKGWTRPRPKPPLPPFALYWAGFGQRVEGGRWMSFDLAPGRSVTAGDRLRFAFSPSADGHAYVVARDTLGRIEVLFPPEGLANASRVKARQVYEAPAGPDWLGVDGSAGLDAVYVVAGYDPYQNLEELVERPEMELTPGDRRELLDSTLKALRDGRYVPSDRIRTRTSQTIDRTLQPGAGPAVSQVTLADGARVERPLTREVGLVSALAEVRFASGR